MGLPSEILQARIENELGMCRRYLRHDIVCERGHGLPMEVMVHMHDTYGLWVNDDKVVPRCEHRFLLTISEDYPFEKPRVCWDTPIFHPNIMMPADGGHVCIKQLEGWSFNSTLLSFIKGMEYLISNPNPASPFGTDSCTVAAEYHNRAGMGKGPEPQKTGPRILERV